MSSSKSETAVLGHPHGWADKSVGSRALSKGLAILEQLSLADGSLPLREIAARIELGKASTLRLLRTLEAEGYLTHDSGESYLIAGRAPALRDRAALQIVQAAARPVMHRLATELGETVTLAYLFDDLIRVVDVIESPRHIRMSNYRGRILQPYASSLGKAILAFQTTEVAQNLIDVYGIYPFTVHTLTDPTAIRKELESVRKAGYSVDREETVEGGVCFGAPIRGADGTVAAAISVSQPKARATPDRVAILPNRLRAAVEEIQSRLSDLARLE